MAIFGARGAKPKKQPLELAINRKEAVGIYPEEEDVTEHTPLGREALDVAMA